MGDLIKLDPQYGVRPVGEPLELDPEEIDALLAEADSFPAFIDSTGEERLYPLVDLNAEERDKYQEWWEGQVKANADNHAKPISLASSRDYDSLD